MSNMVSYVWLPLRPDVAGWGVAGANFKLDIQIISAPLSHAVAGIGQWNYFEQCEAFHALFYNNNKNLYR